MSQASRTSKTKTPGGAASASDSSSQICTVRIELRGSDPLIWRQIEVPTSITLDVLHDVIQIAMGWRDCHPWEFKIGKQRYGLPMEDDWGAVPRAEADGICLRDVLKPRKTTIDYLTTSVTPGSIASPPPTSAKASPALHTHAISSANGPHRPKTAAGYRASTVCSTPGLTPSTRAMPRSRGGSMTTTQS